MTHEPECECGTNAHTAETCEMCSCPELRAAYRRGYNDHARSVQHWQDTHGAYRGDTTLGVLDPMYGTDRPCGCAENEFCQQCDSPRWAASQ